MTMEGATNRRLRIGYMVPEFPGQTHVFFWREIAELEKLGLEIEIVSTRRPPVKLRVHRWTNAAEARTFYLRPLAKNDGVSLNWSGLLKCIRMIVAAEDVSFLERGRLLALLPYSAKLAHRARDRGWQHMHAHCCFRAADVVLFASILSGVPYSISKHGPDWGIGNQRNKWRHARFGTVLTNVMKAEVLSALQGHLPPEICILAMGVDIRKFTRRQPYEPFDKQSKLRIFSCGRIDPGKGFGVTLEMVAELRRRGIAAELRIAGGVCPSLDQYKAKLDRRITELHLDDCVEFLGGISEEAVVAELSRAHVFVLASTAEPLGVAYMEAMAMELPTIGTDAGGVPELIRHGETGFLVKPGEHQAMTDIVEWLTEHPREAVEVGRAARRFIEEHYQSRHGAKVLFDAIRRSTEPVASPLRAKLRARADV